MENVRLIFRMHALMRMFERRIGIEDVQKALATGETIEDYPEDKPYPTKLILGYIGSKPLHVVVAGDDEMGEVIVVTVYEPDSGQWDSTFRRRKRP